jgi:predicted Zn-dependent protease
LEEEAVAHYRAAIVGDLPESDLRETYLGLASTRRAPGRDDEAGEAFRDGFERFPRFRPLRVFQAMHLYNAGRRRDAIEQLITVLLESTNDATILRYKRALSEWATDLDRSWLDGTT